MNVDLNDEDLNDSKSGAYKMANLWSEMPGNLCTDKMPLRRSLNGLKMCLKWSIKYIKNGNPKIPGINDCPPNSTLINAVKILSLVRIEPGTSGLLVNDFTTES